MADDYARDTTTTGSVSVGGTAAGEIETGNDFDWFRVELVSGKTYVIDLEGSDSGGGTLDSTVLRGLYDADGARIAGTQTNDGGDGDDARLMFTASESGTYYIAARGYASTTGTYTVRVTETVSDDTRDGATDLFDITDLGGPRFPRASLDGEVGEVDYFRFTLSEAKEVGLGLRQLDADADLILEDAEGRVLHRSEEDGTANEWISETLLAGTYYVRVEAQEAGENAYRLRYGVSDADSEKVAALEAAQEGDTNEAPAFAESSYAFDLAENADGSTDRVALGSVLARDPEGAALTYSITEGNDADLFAIDASTGALSYKGTGEDHESETTSYALTVRASDGSLHSDVAVTVSVTDVAEAPAFAQASYAFDLAENADGSTERVALGSVLARDPEGAALTYSITEGNDADLFEIDASTGALSYKGTGEDFESETTSYALTVRASDGSLHADTTVTVSVTDVDEAPAFAETSYAFDLAENADGSTERVALGSVSASDPEGAALTYSIAQGNDADLFEIDASTGALSYKGTGEDHESETANYALTVRASDGSLHADATVSVTETVSDDPRAGATDLFDITDLGGPKFPSALLDGEVGEVDYFRFTLSEAKEVGLGLRQLDADADLFLEDAEGRVLHRSEKDGTGNEWISETLLAGTYYVRVEAQEAGENAYRLRYGVSDAGPAKVAALEAAQDGDTNEAPAFAESSYAFDLAENADGSTERVALGSVSASDPEGAALTYSIAEGNDADLFEIDASTGALSYKGTGEDHESETTSYALTVRASDGTLHADATVTISVTDVDEAPAFAETSYAFDLAENADGSTERVALGRVSASDPEGTALTYSIAEGNDADLFAIDASTGALSYKGTGEDYESDTTSYALTVRASDGTLHSDTTVTVSVTDVVEETEAPIVQLQMALQTVSEPAGEDFSEDSSTRGRVVVGESATGEIEFHGDRDWFAVTLEANRAYQFDLEGSETDAGTLMFSYLYGIHDADGNRFDGTTNDHILYYANSRVFFTTFEAGTHYVSAGGREWTRGTYTLSVNEISDDYLDRTDTTGVVTVGGSATGETEFHGDHDWFAVTLEANKIYRFDLEGAPSGEGTLLDPDLGGIYDAEGNEVHATIFDYVNGYDYNYNSRAFFWPAEDATYYVSATSFWRYVGTYKLSVQEVAIEDSADFTADTDTAGVVTVGGSAMGEVDHDGDRDWFAVDLEAGRTYMFDLQGRWTADGKLSDPYLYGIHDADGDLIDNTTRDDSWSSLHFSYDSRVLYPTSGGGTYYVSVGGDEGEEGAYTLSVTDVTENFSDDIFDNDITAWIDTTGEVTVGGSTTGEIEFLGDRDWFAVTLEADKSYRLDLEGSRTDSGTLRDPYLRGIHNAEGALIDGTTNDDIRPYNFNSRLTFSATENATYYVAAGGGPFSHDVGTYTLSVEEVADTM